MKIDRPKFKYSYFNIISEFWVFDYNIIMCVHLLIIMFIVLPYSYAATKKREPDFWRRLPVSSLGGVKNQIPCFFVFFCGHNLLKSKITENVVASYRTRKGRIMVFSKELLIKEEVQFWYLNGFLIEKVYNLNMSMLKLCSLKSFDFSQIFLMIRIIWMFLSLIIFCMTVWQT